MPRLLFISALCCALTACKQPDSTPPQAPPATQATAQTTPPAATSAAMAPEPPRLLAPLELSSPAPQPDDALLAAMQRATSACALDVGRPSSCESPELDALVEQLKASPYAALPTLAVAISSQDAGLHDFATWMLQNAFPPPSPRDASLPGTPLALARLMEILAKSSDTQTTTRIARVVTWLAVQSGEAEAIFALLKAHPHAPARIHAYRDAMRTGDTQAQPYLEKISRDEREARLIRKAALRAPLQAETFTASTCAWMKQLLPVRDSMLEPWPAQSMTRCGPAYIDALLAQARTRLDDASYTNAFGRALDDLCPLTTTREEKLPATPEQCEVVAALLERAVLHEQLNVQTRAHALRTLGQLRPTQETLTLMVGLAANEDAPRLLRSIATQDQAPLKKRLTP